jgi:Domain of Unknown Function (DUF1080)
MLSRRRFVASLPLIAQVASAGDEIALFDGSSTAGWLTVTGEPFPTRSWSIKDSCLHAQPPQKGAFQDIRTVEEFEFFDLSFEWKVAPGGNSGVKYSLMRADSFRPKDDPEGVTGMHARARGFEFQLADQTTPDVKRGPEYSAGSLYGLYAPTPLADVRAGEFNSARIVYTATRIEHWINGKLLVQTNPASEEFAAQIRASKDPRLLTRPRRSPIALQNHSSAAWFRNLKLRQLN